MAQAFGEPLRIARPLVRLRRASAIGTDGSGTPAGITGTSGDDVLYGTGGPDTIDGLGGNDSFQFDRPNPGGIARIMGFNPADDVLDVWKMAFGDIGPSGALNPNAFVIGTSAQDADDRFIYDPATGALFFDADGNASGAAFQFAILVGAPTISAADFHVTNV